MSGDESTTRAVLVRITGRVQGVSFRAWTRDTALGLGLAGWVRNEPDGSVTALLSGPTARVDAMLSMIRAGPPGAQVAAVCTTPAFLRPDLAGFRVLR
jgi:acylphosphatase